MNSDIIVTSNFRKKAKRLIKKYHSLKGELADLAKQLAKNPDSGTPLGSDCYKIRIAVKSKGKGKSGGARIITNYKIENNIVYLLSIYDKSELNTISDNDLKRLLRETEI